MWSPPGLKQPWPEDEYLCDGGDRETQVRVAQDWTVRGLDQEDTVAHFDTKDGRTIVEPSNCVCIYAPRFSAVRRVDALVQYKQRQHMAGMQAPLIPGVSEERLGPTTVIQPLQPLRHLASTPLDIFREETRGLTVDLAEVPGGTESAFLPYEDFLLIRRGQFDLSEKPRLTERIDAALVWTDNAGVQVVIDDTLATEAAGTSKLESVYRYELKGKPRLRICKVASAHTARPGEFVEFTLRFDNIGDQTIGNVTIIDHLTTRLEYVKDSESSTLDADFFAIDDEDVSLILRWEIKDPVKVGKGGVIRFKCRVR